MIMELAVAFGIAILITVSVGTIIRSVIGLRSKINWFVQTAVAFGVVTALSLTTPQAVLIIAMPTVLHGIQYGLSLYVIWRAARGYYGKEAKWAYELFRDDDQDFIYAQQRLPNREIREVKIIADSKDELRELMIERYNELSQNS